MLKTEVKFLKQVIDDFKTLLLYKDKGYFDNLNYQAVYETVATSLEDANLSIFGTMMYFYYQVYKEPYPKTPTDSQKEMVDAVWKAMGKSELVGKYSP